MVHDSSVVSSMRPAGVNVYDSPHLAVSHPRSPLPPVDVTHLLLCIHCHRTFRPDHRSSKATEKYRNDSRVIPWGTPNVSLHKMKHIRRRMVVVAVRAQDQGSTMVTWPTTNAFVLECMYPDGKPFKSYITEVAIPFNKCLVCSHEPPILARRTRA